MEFSEKLEELDQSRLSKASDTTREVSYAVLDVSQKNTTGVLEKFAITINVQLTLQPGQEIPFIPFNGFDKVKEVSKLFLYGPSGCGKSRCIYELVKERITNFKEIFVINPRHTTGAKESGRAKLTELLARFSHEDAVIWAYLVASTVVVQNRGEELEVNQSLRRRDRVKDDSFPLLLALLLFLSITTVVICLVLLFAGITTFYNYYYNSNPFPTAEARCPNGYHKSASGGS